MKPGVRPTITITFGDVAENHRGMEKIGEMSSEGFELEDISFARRVMKAQGCETELYDLRDLVKDFTDEIPEEAFLLVIRGGVNGLLRQGADSLEDELLNHPWDSKAFMYGRVVEKRARHNVCYDDFASQADYEKGKGTVIAFSQVPLLEELRRMVSENLGPKFQDLKAEGNLYYDPKKCGIGMHGDTERRKVLAVRLGTTIPIWMQWYHRHKPVGQKGMFTLNHGDMYIFSSKASGFDWRSSSFLTLRHAAGNEKWSK